MQNTQPIFTLNPVVANARLTGNIANTASDGGGNIGTTMTMVKIAGVNGSFLSRIRIQPVASVAGTAMTASVIRFFLSDQTSGATTSSNTFNIYEVSVAALTADHATNSANFYDIPLNFAIPSGKSLLVSIHANMAANTSQDITLFGGDY